jgi:NTE family protein
MPKRALILGGGGPVGIAWASGLLAGFAEGGVSLENADFIAGTSAGSFVGAQIALGKAAAALATPIIAEEAPTQRAGSSSAQPSGPAPDLTTLIAKMGEAVSGKRPAKEVRAEIGRWALEARTISEEAFLAGFGRSFNELPDDLWPDRDYACTAVDALSGEFVVWKRDSGVGVKRAVASSCSVPGVFPPITIKGRRYVDGGMRSPTNADLAKGYDIAIVVAVTGAAANPAMADQFRKLLDKEIAATRDSGTRVELIVPDAASIKAFGINLMDPRRRPGAAKAGLTQGRTQAASLKSFWTS